MTLNQLAKLTQLNWVKVFVNDNIINANVNTLNNVLAIYGDRQVKATKLFNGEMLIKLA